MVNIISAIDAITNNFRAEIGVILGSGLGGFTSVIDIKYTIPYSEISGFPTSTTKGHDGELIFGYVDSRSVIVMKGRFHYYEGYSSQMTTIPIRLMKLLGVKHLLLSNAAGAVNRDYKIGDVIIINNHINFIPNPLIGKNDDEFGSRFPDMKAPYSQRLIDIAKKIDAQLCEGVYAAMTGPSYETSAEINMLRVIGADIVGMSTTPEVIVARHADIEVFAISVVTNDTSEAEVTHQEVIDVGIKAGEKMNILFKKIIALI